MSDTVKTLIYETTEYDKFKKLKGNRIIDPVNVEQLIKSLSVKQGISPIIVNENYEVIDGQHRLEACKQLGLPVFYAIEEGAGGDEIVRYNTNIRNWQTVDYLRYYEENGSQSARRFLQVMGQFDVSPSVVAEASSLTKDRYIGFNRTNNMVNWFNDDSYTEENAEAAKEKLKKVMVVYDILKDHNLISRDAFIKTMLTFVNNEGFDYEYFLKNVKEYGDRYSFKGTSPIISEQIVRLYNRNRRKKFLDLIPGKKARVICEAEYNRWR